MTRRLASALALFATLALTFAGCGGGDDATTTTATVAGPPVRIGSKNFKESEIIGELYAQALREKGVRVELRSQVGPTETTNAALRNGSLDMYPEYIGVLLSVVDGIEDRPASVTAAYDLARRQEEGRGFTLLEQSRLSNENALAVTKAFGRRTGVRSITDLTKLRPRPRLGVAPEFLTRFEGMIGLRERYGLRGVKTEFVDPNTGEGYIALDGGKVDVALVFTTDSQLAGGRYTILADPKGVFQSQRMVPIISKKVLAAHGPVLPDTLNAVSALLSNTVMRKLNAEAVDGRSPTVIAADFLREHGLIDR